MSEQELGVRPAPPGGPSRDEEEASAVARATGAMSDDASPGTTREPSGISSPNSTPGNPETATPLSQATEPPANAPIPAPTDDPSPPPASPLPRRPAPPKKGILKPPPPPVKQGLITSRLRDALGSIGVALEEGVGAVGQGGPASGVGNAVRGGVGGAAALVGTWGGRFGRLIGAQLPAGQGQGPVAPGSPGSASKLGPLPSSPSGGSSSLPPPSAAASTTSTSLPSSTSTSRPLKRASFLLPAMSITYPISTAAPAWSEAGTAERTRIEQARADEMGSQGRAYWTRERLVGLYERACKVREERVRLAVRNALLASIPSPTSKSTLRQIHLTAAPVPAASSSTLQTTFHTDPLDRHACEALADVLALDWGLERLILEAGVLDGDDCLKPVLHALLVAGSLPHLSIAGNKKLKPSSFRILGAYLRKAKSLRYLDVSDNILDRKSVECICAAFSVAKATEQALANGKDADASAADTTMARATDELDEKQGVRPNGSTPPKVDGAPDTPRPIFTPSAPLLRDDDGLEAGQSNIRTLRMDGCSLKAGSLEVLGPAIRHSEIQNLSIRRNRITNLGAVAVAVMMKDYPDAAAAGPSRVVTSLNSSAAGTPEKSAAALPAVKDSVASSAAMSRDHSLDGTDIGSARSQGHPVQPPPRHPALAAPGTPTPASRTLPRIDTAARREQDRGTSMAISRQVRMMENVETVGHLQTLDLKGNEIRGGVTYIAQVLKRNRTLKLLNLSDNRIDHLGLVAIADALKYNSTLETLDLSQNPCSGPSLEGVQALRSAVTVNNTLKRLFLAGTHLVTDGAIILAEYLPEAKSLLHVDLSDNPGISVAGVMALGVALRSNSTIRCLDLTVPTDNQELAELCQPILQSCIRNTEAYIASKGGKLSPAAQDAIWAPIRNSKLVKCIRGIEAAKAIAEVKKAVDTPAGQAREMVYGLRPDGVLRACEEVAEDLQRFVKASEDVTKPQPFDRAEASLLLERAKALLERVADLIQDTTEAERMERLLGLNDVLTPLLVSAEAVLSKSARRRPLSVEINPAALGGTPSPSRSATNLRRHIRVPSMEMSSPNFSITNSDDDNDSDAEELVPAIRRSMGLVTPVPSRKQPSSALSLGGLGMERTDGTDQPSDDERFIPATPAATSEIIPDSCPSPLERVNRDWMAEEGEIFRKGTKLGVAEEDDDEEQQEVPGEELKLKILDTEVERSPHKPIAVDDDLHDKLNDDGGVPQEAE